MVRRKKRNKGGIVLLSLIVLSIASMISGATVFNQTGPANGGRDVVPVDCKINFLNEEILTNPTYNSVQLKMKSGEAADVYVEYGTLKKPFKERTETQSSSGPGHFTFELDKGLKAGKEYEYRVRCKATNESEFGSRESHTFKTLKKGYDETVKFAYATDSHIVNKVLKSWCDPNKKKNKLNMKTFNQSLKNMLNGDDYDFVFIGGDNAGTHNTNDAPCSNFPQYGSGSVKSPDEADLRYELMLSQWDKITDKLPLLYLLGNHEGESNYIQGNESPKYGYHKDLWNLSRAARLRHLPDPTEVYEGSSNSDLYYTFASGPVRIIVLDVMAGNDDLPVVETWTLGTEQKTWLKGVLERSDEPWKIVFIEHLVGGHCGCSPGDLYNYGRGGLLAVDKGINGGNFSGEQEEIHRMMRDNGVQVFAKSHDHVAVAGEAVDNSGIGEGIYYVNGGQPTRGVQYGQDGWSDGTWIHQYYDYDGDGVGDFMSNVTGAAIPGFYRITANGRDNLTLEFLQSNVVDPQFNNLPAYEFTIFPDGTSTLP